MKWRNLLNRLLGRRQGESTPPDGGLDGKPDSELDGGLDSDPDGAGFEDVSDPLAQFNVDAWPRLTQRETEVAWYIRRGLSNEQIAAELGIAATTVKSHVHRLLVKFNVRSRFVLRNVLKRWDFYPWDE